MDTAINQITTQGLVIAFVPALIAIVIMYRWAAGATTAVYATARMLAQLLLIGYVLVYIFEADRPMIILAVLVVMLVAASFISIRPLKER